VASALKPKPAVVGHSFGGLLTEIVAGRGLSRASVAVSPAPFRGVLPLPVSALRVALVALRNPLNRGRAVGLSAKQFRYGFGNGVSEDESAALYEKFSVAAPGRPLFQAAFANINPWTEDKVDTGNPARGPLLIVSGELDHTVPWSIANASFNKERRNPGLTEIVRVAGRGHSLTIDSGSDEVAQLALDFIGRFVKPSSACSHRLSSRGGTPRPVSGESPGPDPSVDRSGRHPFLPANER